MPANPEVDLDRGEGCLGTLVVEGCRRERTASLDRIKVFRER